MVSKRTLEFNKNDGYEPPPELGGTAKDENAFIPLTDYIFEGGPMGWYALDPNTFECYFVDMSSSKALYKSVEPKSMPEEAYKKYLMKWAGRFAGDA